MTVPQGLFLPSCFPAVQPPACGVVPSQVQDMALFFVEKPSSVSCQPVSPAYQGLFVWQHSCPQPPHIFAMTQTGSLSLYDTNPPFVKCCEETLLLKFLANKRNKKISRNLVHQRKLLFHVSKSHFLWTPIINQEKQQCFTARQFSRNLWMLGSGKLEKILSCSAWLVILPAEYDYINYGYFTFFIIVFHAFTQHKL